VSVTTLCLNAFTHAHITAFIITASSSAAAVATAATTHPN